MTILNNNDYYTKKKNINTYIVHSKIISNGLSEILIVDNSTSVTLELLNLS